MPVAVLRSPSDDGAAVHSRTDDGAPVHTLPQEGLQLMESVLSSWRLMEQLKDFFTNKYAQVRDRDPACTFLLPRHSAMPTASLTCAHLHRCAPQMAPLTDLPPSSLATQPFSKDLWMQIGRFVSMVRLPRHRSCVVKAVLPAKALAAIVHSTDLTSAETRRHRRAGSLPISVTMTTMIRAAAALGQPQSTNLWSTCRPRKAVTEEVSR